MNRQPRNRNKTPFLKRTPGTNDTPIKETSPCANTQTCADSSMLNNDMWHSALHQYHVPACLWDEHTQAQFLCPTDEHNNHVHLEPALVPSFHVYEFQEVSSTNILIKQAIDADAPEGIAALAHQQRAGYGRQGRKWNSQPGGMYLSFLLRPRVRQAEYPSLALVVGLALRNFLAERLRGTPRESLAPFMSVKWPNDVLAPCIVPHRNVMPDTFNVFDGANIPDTPDVSDITNMPDGAHLPRVSELACVRDTSSAQQHAASVEQNHATSLTHIHGNNTAQTDVARSEQIHGARMVQKPFADEYIMGKLAGISCEVHRNALCVGVGLNIQVPETCERVPASSTLSQPLFAPAYWEPIAATQRPSTYEYIAHIACDFLAYFSAPYALWQEKGFAPFVDAYTKFSYLTGKMVHIVNQNGTEHARGRVTGVHPSGCLLVNACSNARLISSGEVHITHISDYHSKNGK